MFEEFLYNLFASGETIVGSEPLRYVDSGKDQALAALREEYERAKGECPGLAPRFDPEAARMGALLLYNGCVCLANRALGEAEVMEALPVTQSPPADAGAVFSADLALSRLPTLLRFAEGAAPGDPLVQRLLQLGSLYPLSSVGTKAAPKPEAEAIVLGHRGLRQLYADRVIQTQDKQRLANPEVLLAAREALGGFTDLWPEIDRVTASNEVEKQDA